ncbi:MAG: ABC-2 family transporter protein [Bacillota bacterium]|nr:ABC-2 family transporter protein [Bacillota bacterium]
MKKYFTITKKVFRIITVFRFNFIFSIIGNLLYIIILYFLWGAIYSSGAKKLNGMTFNQVFVYLSLASTIFMLFSTYLEWGMSREVIEGSIVMHFVKPVDLQMYKLFESLGFVLINFVTVTLPSILMILVVFRPQMPLGINLIFFPLSLILAYFIMFNIDFFVGLLCFYNESTWGMSSAKDSIVMLLSGAVIPISFFPGTLKTIVNFLPFQAVYNIPLDTLVSYNLNINDYLRNIVLQLVWVVILFIVNRLFFRKAVKVVTVNGG